MRVKPIHKQIFLFFVLLCGAAFVLCGAAVASGVAAPAAEMFTVTFATDKGEFSYIDEPIEPTDYLVADEMFTRKINAPLTEKRAMMSKAVRAGASYERAVTLCMPKAAETVDAMERALYEPALDAEMTFDPKRTPPFMIKREKNGRMLDREKTFELIYICAMRGAGESIAPPFTIVRPEVTSEKLIARTYLRADFSTEFASSNADRSHNIALALSHVDGTVLNPGDEFSFNKTVGARTESRGFRQAKIIMDGDYVLGYGGGVCQASTTIYNAALRAGLEITEVHAHSLSSGYVAASLDAMFNSSSADLKFKNPLSDPVFISAYAYNGTARVRIFGLKSEFKIVPVSVVRETVSPPEEELVADLEHKYLPAEAESGDRLTVRNPKDGIKSEAYLEYYRGTTLVRRIKIRSDSYRPLRGMTVFIP